MVYVGTLSAVRRLDVIVRAFAEVRRHYPYASLLLVGDGDEPRERQALEALVAQLGLGPAVRFTGQVPIEQAWELCATAAVCLSPFYPSRVLASTSPTKLIEYMALGRPVVCNVHPEQAQIIRESGAGLCVEWGMGSFAEAIMQLLEDPERAEAMGARGPSWVAANRAYPVIARKVHECYVELLGGNTTRRAAPIPAKAEGSRRHDQQVFRRPGAARALAFHARQGRVGRLQLPGHGARRAGTVRCRTLPTIRCWSRWWSWARPSPAWGWPM